ncbi:MAG: FAD binding domain-containing protein [Planctomycetota bacterium]
MLRLPTFELEQPATLSEAVRTLAAAGAPARVVAGGTDLWPNMKRRHQQARTVVSLAGVRELSGVHGMAGRELRVGAMTTLSDLASHSLVRASWPALARALTSISSPVLRNMGTIGGNLCLDTRCTYYNQNEEWRRSIDYCMKAEGTVCWVAPGSPRCWAISASDSAPALCALRARVRLVSSAGERVIDLTELYHDDGMSYLRKDEREILVEVIVPPAERWSSAFWKLRRRGSIDYAVLTVAPAVERDAHGVVTAARIFMGAVASCPVRASEAEAALVGKPLNAEHIAEAARLARKSGSPLNNTDFVPQWRSRMIELYMEAALREIAGLPMERLPPQHA